MHKRADRIDGVEIVLRLRGDRGVTELLARPSTGFEKHTGRRGGIALRLPSGSSVADDAGEVSATVMMYP